MAYCTCVCEFDEAEDNVIQWCATHKFVLDNAVKAEREACAEIADERAGGKAFKRGAAIRIAELIRART